MEAEVSSNVDWAEFMEYAMTGKTKSQESEKQEIEEEISEEEIDAMFAELEQKLNEINAQQHENPPQETSSQETLPQETVEFP